MYHPVRDTIVILEEGNHPHPRCPACDIFVLWVAVNRHHPSLDLCSQGSYSKRHFLEEEEAWAGASTALRVHGRPLETVSSLKYLGRLLTASENDWPDVISNLWKERKS